MASFSLVWLGRTSMVGILAVVLAACSGTTTVQPSSGPGGSSGGAQASPSAGAGGGGGSAAAGAAAALEAAEKDPCSIMPVDVVRAILPKAGEPHGDVYGNSCQMDADGDGVVAVTIDVSWFSYSTPNPCEPVSGLGQWACVQEQTLGTAVDSYLTVIVTPGDPSSAVNHAIFTVEVTGPAGTSRKDDAVKVAKAVLAAIGG
jgi:hypothetical protein